MKPKKPTKKQPYHGTKNFATKPNQKAHETTKKSKITHMSSTALKNHKESSSNTTNEGVTRRFKFTETYVFSQKVTFNFCKNEKKTKIFKDGFRIF